MSSEIETTPVLGEYETVRASEPPGMPTPSKSNQPLWRNRDYMLLWSGQVVSVIGTGASQIVYPLLILSLTNSPAAAGAASALASLPYVFFSLPAGAMIDRWDRKKVMILCDIGRAITLGSIPVALAFNALTIWQIYIASVVEGSLFVFFNIAEVAALSRVVTKDRLLPQAAAQNDAAFGVAGVLRAVRWHISFSSLGMRSRFSLIRSRTYSRSFLYSLSRLNSRSNAKRRNCIWSEKFARACTGCGVNRSSGIWRF